MLLFISMSGNMTRFKCARHSLVVRASKTQRVTIKTIIAVRGAVLKDFPGSTLLSRVFFRSVSSGNAHERKSSPFR